MKVSLLPLLALCLFPAMASAQEKPKPPVKAYADPAATDEDYIIQGEYSGEKDGKKFGAQIIALGDGKFEAVSYRGGLPGDGWDGDKEGVTRTQSARQPDNTTTVTFQAEHVKGEVDGTTIYVSSVEGDSLMELSRVSRTSPTLGVEPPQGAVVLFGKDVNRFPKSNTTEDGLLTQGATSEPKFTDFTLHLEFRLPYVPTARGQARGNSGVYLQGRYEVQMLDSFGLEGKDNECGGLYTLAAPKVNMCYPPLTWQTYDIDFTAAKYDGSGKKTTNARVTVKHNGVLIHDNVELREPTRAAPVKEEANTPGPIHLQNHGNPVRYRNIWLVPKA